MPTVCLTLLSTVLYNVTILGIIVSSVISSSPSSILRIEHKPCPGIEVDLQRVLFT